MSRDTLSPELAAEVEELRRRLQEAEDTLEAIRTGAVDALVLNEAGQERVYTLEGADASYRLVLETMNEGVVTVSAEGMVVYCNQCFGDLVGFPCSAVLGGRLHEFVAGTPPDAVERLLEAARAAPQVAELDLLRAGGTTLAGRFSITAFGDSEAPLYSVLVTDLTEQKRAQRLEQRFRDLIDSAPSAIIEYSADGTIMLVNEYASRLFGYEPGELVGKPVMVLVPEVEQETGRSLQGLKDAVVGDPAAFQQSLNQNVTRDGRRLWMLWSNRAVRDEQGRVQAIMTVGLDRTEQHEAEKKLEANRRRLRALAAELAVTEQRERQRLAAALHDEVAQSLGAAKLQLDMIRGAVTSPASAQLAEALALLDQAIRQSRTIMMELSPSILRQGGLVPALRWWGEQVQEKHGRPVKVEIQGPVTRLSADVEATLFQAVKELLQNAVKYARATEAQIRITCADALEIEVADNGIGFDPAAAQVTETGGFGLFSVRERVDYLGGQFEIDSAPGRGTRERITLPLPCSLPGALSTDDSTAPGGRGS